MAKMFKQPSPEMVALAERAAGKHNVSQAEMFQAQDGLAQAIAMDIREGIFAGDVTSDIFTVVPLAPNQYPEFQLAVVGPGEENDFTAWSIPAYGAMPSRMVQQNYIMIPTFRVGNSVQALLQHIGESRSDVVSELQTAMQAGFVKKLNDVCWQTLLAAGYDRDILVTDGDAAIGQLTKRLISGMKITMQRNGGGNSTSTKLSRLTDLYVSPEGIEDVRNWTIDQLDEVSRREIYVANDGSSVLTRIMGVNLRPIHELGEGQPYQLYYTSALAGALGSGDTELAVGLDLQTDNTFVLPVKQQVSIFTDASAHKEQLFRLYGWMEFGCGVLDNRRIIFGSY